MFHMKCMPQSQTGCAGSRFLDNLCALQYWNFKLLSQTCDVPVRDCFTKPVSVVSLRSPVAGVSVLPPACAMADALTFLWFLLVESWCVQHVSSWKGWYPEVITIFKTGHQGKANSRNTARETSFSQSQHLFTHKILCTYRLFLLLRYSGEEVLHRECRTGRSLVFVLLMDWLSIQSYSLFLWWII